MKRSYQTDLTEPEWETLKPYVPAPNKRGRPRIHSSRKVLDAARGVGGGTVDQEVAEARVAAFQIRGTLRRASRKLQVEGVEDGIEGVGREEHRALYSPDLAPREEDGRQPGEGDQKGPVEGDHLRVHPHGHEQRDQAQVEPQEVQEGADQIARGDLRPALPGRECLADHLLDLYGRRGNDHADQERREAEGGDDTLGPHGDQLATDRNHGEAEDGQADGLRVRAALVLGLPHLFGLQKAVVAGDHDQVGDGQGEGREQRRPRQAAGRAPEEPHPDRQWAGRHQHEEAAGQPHPQWVEHRPEAQGDAHQEDGPAEDRPQGHLLGAAPGRREAHRHVLGLEAREDRRDGEGRDPEQPREPDQPLQEALRRPDNQRHADAEEGEREGHAHGPDGVGLAEPWSAASYTETANASRFSRHARTAALASGADGAPKRSLSSTLRNQAPSLSRSSSFSSSSAWKSRHLLRTSAYSASRASPKAPTSAASSPTASPRKRWAVPPNSRTSWAAPRIARSPAASSGSAATPFCR